MSLDNSHLDTFCPAFLSDLHLAQMFCLFDADPKNSLFAISLEVEFKLDKDFLCIAAG